MFVVFQRAVFKSGEVKAEIVVMDEGLQFRAGTVAFPSKQLWSKFVGAFQRGALEVPDLEVRLENVPVSDEVADTIAQVEGASSANIKPNPAG